MPVKKEPSLSWYGGMIQKAGVLAIFFLKKIKKGRKTDRLLERGA
jgi:hypothetical protein